MARTALRNCPLQVTKCQVEGVLKCFNLGEYNMLFERYSMQIVSSLRGSICFTDTDVAISGNEIILSTNKTMLYHLKSYGI